MLADTIQIFAVILIIAAAVGYLLVIARRSWKSGEGGACSGCHGGDQTLGAARPADPPAVQFIPLDNLKDAARRHRQTARPEPPPEQRP